MAQGNDVRRRVNQAARSANADEIMDKWMRLGFAARGVLFALIGWLAIRLVTTGKGAITDQTGALAYIAGQPGGRPLLILITVGLTGYAMYCFIRALFDPMHQGHDTMGLVTRLGYFISGLVYGAIIFPAYQMIQGGPGQAGSGTANIQQFAAGAMTHPMGRLLVGLVGIVMLGIGVYEIYFGWTEGFTRKFDTYRMNHTERVWATRMGRFGYMALGVVIGLIGFLLLLSAVNYKPQQAGGIDASLVFLLHQPYGPILLLIVAAGLIAYAIYSFMGAIWFRIKMR